MAFLHKLLMDLLPILGIQAVILVGYSLLMLLDGTTAKIEAAVDLELAQAKLEGRPINQALLNQTVDKIAQG